MISPKQKKILAFQYTNYDALICDGAVRSGKTSIMAWTFVWWAMDNFNCQRFGICGKTVDSATKNIIMPFMGMSLAQERYRIRWRRADKVMEVRRGNVVNLFEVFGGKDEASFALIQGRTLAGVLLDEVVLMPRSFVEQAAARCSVDGARLWFSCNPGSPNHWFYNEWITQRKKRNALYLHFEMRDNPGLSEKTIQRYENMYTGVFYERYVKGRWIPAEGLIYPMFDDSCIVDTLPEKGDYYISCDYGTMNPFSAGLWRFDGKTATRIREYYYSGRDTKKSKTDEEYATEIDNLSAGLPIKCVVVDPSAASFIEVLRRHNYAVKKAKNNVEDGIMLTARFLSTGKIKIARECKDCIREFGLYRWDEKAGEDRPIKENDHAMDDTRYFVYTVMRHKVDKQEYRPIWST